MSYYQTPEGKDPQLWQLARRRASFKTHFFIYLVVNAGLWLLWWLTGSIPYRNSIPWPAWTTFGWGIGIVSHYMSAYVTHTNSSVENEYNKLLNKKTNQL